MSRSDPSQFSSGSSSQEGFSEVNVRVISLNEVDVTAGTNIVTYRDEGFYLVILRPDMIVEVEGKFGKRYFGVGKLYSYHSEADEALVNITNIMGEINGFDLLYLPKRLLRELKEIIKNVKNGETYIAIIHAAGKGRDRTYSRLKKPIKSSCRINVDDEELQTALQRLIRFVTAGKNGKEEGEDQ